MFKRIRNLGTSRYERLANKDLDQSQEDHHQKHKRHHSTELFREKQQSSSQRQQRAYSRVEEVVKEKSNKLVECVEGEANEADVLRFYMESVRPTFRRRRGGLSESLLRKDLEMFRVHFIDARLRDYNLI